MVTGRLVGQRLVERTRRLRRYSRARRLLDRVLEMGARLVPKDPSQVVVHGLDESEDGALALVAALEERGLVPVRLTAGADGSTFRSPGARYRSKYTLGGFWAFARARLVFTSQALYGGLGGGPGQQTVMLWHGEVVKPVGLLDEGRPLAADVAPVCSTLAHAFRVAEFGLHPRQVPIVGSPRNDRLLSADRAAIRTRLQWPADRPVWLWLPTYRTAVRGERRSDGQQVWQGLPYSEAELDAASRALADAGFTLVLKPHPLAEQQLSASAERGLQVLSQSDLERLGVSLYEVMAAVDGLVTDASSVWVDFLLVDKPMVFAFPDLEQYRVNRGLNLEPYEDWVPGPLVRSLDEVLDQMRRAASGEDSYAERRLRARRRFHRFVDNGSTSRLLTLLDLPSSSELRAAAASPSSSPTSPPLLGRRRRTRR